MNHPIPIRLVTVILCISLFIPACAAANTLGPAGSYDELLALATSASDGDVLLISGELSALGGAPLSISRPESKGLYTHLTHFVVLWAGR